MKKSLVQVNQFDVFDLRDSAILPGGVDVDFKITCSKGTYIRSLAHDLGQALGCGGFLSALRRAQIGDFKVEDAIGPEEFSDMMDSIEEQGSDQPTKGG